MSNDSPPRACLADFGFMKMVLDSRHSMWHSPRLEGGTMMFMSPELLVPKKFGRVAVPTPEADIYAFGLVIYLVCERHRGCLSFTYIVQVLTGDIPFPKLRMGEITLNVAYAVRPPKPEKASAIGFSDSLWRFVQRCWDGDAELRPKVAGVVSQLERAAADWVGVMPPCPLVKNVASASLEQESDSMAHCKLYILVPLICPVERRYRRNLRTVFGYPPRKSSRFENSLPPI